MASAVVPTHPRPGLARVLRIAAGLLLCLLHWHAQAVPLTEAEQAYLKGLGPVTLCVDPDWAPFEVIDADGKYVGIAADLLALVSQRTGVALQLLRTKDWPDSLEASRAGRCTLLGLLNQTAAREAWLVFTRPMLIDDNILVTREEHPFIADLGRFADASMALPKGTSIEEWMLRDYPNIRLIMTDTEAEALELVSARKVDMTMRSLIVAAYTIKHEGWFNLKIAGQVPGHGNALRIGVAKDQPMLRDILDKGVASITPFERQQIIDGHITIAVTQGIDYRLIANLAVVLVLVMATSLFWLRKLKRANNALRRSEAALRESKDTAEATAAGQRQFIAMMSHEVRTPLTIIDSAVQLLKLHAQDKADQMRVIDRISRGSARLATFFEDCLTADRINSDDFTIAATAIDVRTLLDTLVEQATQLSGKHAIKVVASDDLPTLQGDPTLLRILLLNLVSNALKYSPDDTTVTVRVRCTDTQYRFAVEDQGPGIPEDEAQLILQKYRRGEAAHGTAGVGLGLAIVQRIAALHCGGLKVEARQGGGSAFIIEIPRQALQNQTSTASEVL